MQAETLAFFYACYPQLSIKQKYPIVRFYP
jgi:hypothetical protein